MSKRKYSYSSSDDSDDDDESGTSSSREKEELKALFCSYIDRLSRKRKKKRKVVGELAQSFRALPFLHSKETKTEQKNVSHKLRETDSSSDEKVLPNKQNLKTFFEKRISRLWDAHKKSADYKFISSDSSDFGSNQNISDSKKKMNIFKGHSAKMILKDKLSNHKRQELVKKWRDEHFENEFDEHTNMSDNRPLAKQEKIKVKIIRDRIEKAGSSASISSVNSPHTVLGNSKPMPVMHNISSRESSVNGCSTEKVDLQKEAVEEAKSSVGSQDACISTSQNVGSTFQVDKVLMSGTIESHDKMETVEGVEKHSHTKINSEPREKIGENSSTLLTASMDKDEISKDKKIKTKKTKSKQKSHRKIKSKNGEEKQGKSHEKRQYKQKINNRRSHSRSRECPSGTELSHNKEANSKLIQPETSKPRHKGERSRKDKAKNQIDLSRTKSSFASFEQDMSDIYDDNCREHEKHNRQKRPKVKRVRNFLSLNSSVEEVYSDKEASNVRRRNKSPSTESSPLEATSADDGSNRIQPRWSRSSECSGLSKNSSPWHVDLEKQKPYKQRYNSSENDQDGRCEFKKKSCNKVKERLRQTEKEDEASAEESADKRVLVPSVGAKRPKVVIDFEEPTPPVAGPSDGKQQKLSYEDEKNKNVTEQSQKSNEKLCIPGKRASSKNNDDSAVVIMDKSVECNKVGLQEVNKTLETPQILEDVGNQDFSPNENLKEQSSLSRAPLKISFKPRAILKNVNKLAEASIKCASLKFNSLYAKKNSKVDELNDEQSDDMKSKSPLEETRKLSLHMGTAMKKKARNEEEKLAESSNSKENEARLEVTNDNVNPSNDNQGNHFVISAWSKDAEKKKKHEPTRASIGKESSRSLSRHRKRSRSRSKRMQRSSSRSSYETYSSRSYDDRSRRRKRRRRSDTYSSRSRRRSYSSRSRSRSYYSSRSSGRRCHSGRRRWRHSSFSSMDSSPRRQGTRRWRSRSQSRRRRHSYSSSLPSRRGGGQRRLRSYKDWSSFSGYSSRSVSRLRSKSRYSSRRRGRSERSRRGGRSRRRSSSQRKVVRSKWDRSTSNSFKTTTESEGAESEINSRGNSENVAKVGHLTYECGDVLGERYEILSTLGAGTFSKVVECVDLKSNKHVALKIIKNVPKYKEAAELEIAILKDIAAKDPQNENFCIRIRSTFEHMNHQCLVFDALGLNLYEFLKNNAYQPYTMDQIRHIGYQLLMAIRFLHGIGLIHTDLKPENVLFVNSDFSVLASHAGQDSKSYNMLKGTDIRLVDFGSAVYDKDSHGEVVSTRQYRALEVILELGWGRPCDVWSVGCILFEMYAGHTLFQTHSNLEHLAMMEAILGPLPPKMVQQSKKNNYFSGDRLRWDADSKDGRYVKKSCKALKKYMTRGDVDHHDLFDVMLAMLTYEPGIRITAEKAVGDRFFARYLKT